MDIDKISSTDDLIGVPTSIRRAAANLDAHCNKLLHTLYSTSASYRLLPPSLECLGDTKLTSLDYSNDKLEAATTQRKRMVQERNTNTFNSNVQKSKAYKYQNKEYNESSDESLFQVTGDWGYDCSDDDDSKSDISSSFKLDPGT